MGGKPKSTSQSYSGSSNPAFQPLALSAAGNVQSVFNQNQPHLQQLTGQADQIVNAGIGKYNSGLGNLGAARGYVGDVLAGNYLHGNPYIQQLLSQMRGDVTNQVNSQFENAGRYGSGAHNQILGRELANAENGVLYQNYSDEMNRMGQAANSAEAASAGDLTQALAPIGVSASLPYTGTESLANSLGALFSGGQEKSKQTGASPIWGAIGAGLGALGTAAAGGAFASDRRLKTKIRLIRREPDGLGWYGWRWKSDPDGPEAFGVIADEVKELRPQAYVPNFRGDGYDGVNYGAL